MGMEPRGKKWKRWVKVSRENWFILTLVTHSLGVSRGIHHKCKHPLNSTRLYVSRWVESSLSVLIWKVITRLGDVCILDCESMSDYIDEIFMALAYPVACLIVLYVVPLLLRWLSTCWCEQMREALDVNREDTISPHSLFGLVIVFCLGFC